MKAVLNLSVIFLLLFTLFAAWGKYFTEHPIGVGLTMMFSVSVSALIAWIIFDMKIEKRCRGCQQKTECERASRCPARFLLELIKTNRIRVESIEQKGEQDGKSDT